MLMIIRLKHNKDLLHLLVFQLFLLQLLSVVDGILSNLSQLFLKLELHMFNKPLGSLVSLLCSRLLTQFIGLFSLFVLLIFIVLVLHLKIPLHLSVPLMLTKNRNKSQLSSFSEDYGLMLSSMLYPNLFQPVQLLFGISTLKEPLSINLLLDLSIELSDIILDLQLSDLLSLLLFNSLDLFQLTLLNK